MTLNDHNKLAENYRGFDIIHVNSRNTRQGYFGILVDGIISAVSCISVKAARNVIDTWIKHS
jgi:hypothetical protein